ncbi:YdcF family protein [Candidatus Sumerlaeota bacterium]|nr:YdcF family protein [Candidatus Sumerlaeota bacterium]
MREVLDEALRTSDRSEDELRSLLERGLLDEHYQGILRTLRWVDSLIDIHPQPEQFTDVRETLSRRRGAILEFYRAHFESHPVLGDTEAHADPDFLFILACRDLGDTGTRVDGALPHIRRHGDRPVVLCGGGFGSHMTEAAFMRDRLMAQGVDESRLILEEDSIDTIGNALFAKLLLRQRGLLPAEGRLLVTTSAFHAVRSFNIFRKVFGPRFAIAIATVRTTPDEEESLHLADHELASDSQSSREIFSFEDFFSGGHREIDAGDDAAMLFQLILHHGFYRHRYDLMRKFADALT